MTTTAHSCYLRNIFGSPQDFRDTVERMVKLIEKRREVYAGVKNAKYIACRGVSGVAVASAVSYWMDMGLIVVRKPNDESHTSYLVEGVPEKEPFTYIIIDDLICSGKTLGKIQEAIYKCSLRPDDTHGDTYVGVFLYNNNSYLTPAESTYFRRP